MGYTKPRQEKLALENLQRQGYEAYLPLLRVRRRRQGKVIHSVEPLFPRYIFIHLDAATDNWGPIRSTIGMSRLVMFGQSPAQVPEDFIGCLQSGEDEQGLQNLPPHEFASGDSVRIVDGALAGYEAVFKARTGKDRVSVLLAFAGAYTQIELSSNQLEPSS